MPVDLERRIGRRSKDSVARTDKRQESKGKPPTVGERLLSLKRDAYWTSEELTKNLSRETDEVKRRVSYALEDIDRYEKDALSHLCLEGYAHNSLRRNGIETISALEELLRKGGVPALRLVCIGTQSILDRLNLFHRRLDAEKPTLSAQPPAPS